MKVCVIGSGPSGLTTIKQLCDEGHDVTCFDTNDELGGIWYRRRDGRDSDEMKVFDNLVLTISAKLMSFSDFIVEGPRVYFTHEEYFRYLQAYAAKFDLRRHVVFETAVERIEKMVDGRFCVTVRKRSAGADGAREEHVFDAVAMCTGSFQRPNMNVKDLGKFQGEVVHSSRYRNPERFRGKRVLVVGLAESGADLLRDISDVARQCTLSIRSYSILVPRLIAGRYPSDAVTTRAYQWETYVRATDVPYPMAALAGESVASRAAFWAAAKVYGAGTLLRSAASALLGRVDPHEEILGDEKNAMGQPMHPIKADLDTEWTDEVMSAVAEWNRRAHNYGDNYSPSAIFSKNIRFIPNIVNGKIHLNDAGIARIQGRTVHFEDGVSKEYDAIVLCTGFEKDFSVYGKDVAVRDNDVRNLYKHAFYPEHDGRLALIGFVRPFTGGIPVCAEMQARYFAQLCSKNVRLPSDVRERIRREKAWEEKWTAFSPRHTEAIPAQALFMDSIAREIGCLMTVTDLVKNPSLFLKHWYGSFNQASYRLKGPHAMPEEAAKELESQSLHPAANSPTVLLHMVSSFLPGFVHVKDIHARKGSPPGYPMPEKTTDHPAHALRGRSAVIERRAAGISTHDTRPVAQAHDAPAASPKPVAKHDAVAPPA